jgi:hypothetical protein
MVQSCYWLAGRRGRKLIWGHARVCCYCGGFSSLGGSNDRRVNFTEVEVANAVFR